MSAVRRAARQAQGQGRPRGVRQDGQDDRRVGRAAQRHPLYKRVIRLTTKFKAHDERNEARIGDTVRIEESRPLSATKRWRLVEIVARADDAGGALVAGEEPETERGHPHGRPPRP